MSLLLLFVGAGTQGPAPPPDLPYQGDVYFYDETTGTGVIGSGTVQSGGTIYDETTGTGAIGSGTVQPGDAIYDDASGTGSITGGTVQPSETIYE